MRFPVRIVRLIYNQKQLMLFNTSELVIQELWNSYLVQKRDSQFFCARSRFDNDETVETLPDSVV